MASESQRIGSPLNKELGSPIKRHLSREKNNPSARNSVFFLGTRRLREWAAKWLVGAAAHLIDSFAPEPIPPKRFTEVSVFVSYLRGSLWSHPLLSLCRSSFRFIGVRLDGTSHPSGSRSAVRLVFLCDPCPLLRTQKIFGSRPCPIVCSYRTYGC